MQMRKWGIGGLVLALSLGVLGGCGAEELNCPKVAGMFVPLYIPLDTSCESLSNPNRVNFDSGTNNASINVTRDFNRDITTEVVLKGCTMRMTQTITDKEGVPQQQIDGESLAIESATEVSGQVTVTMFDPEGQPMCWGVYEAQFTQDNSLFGAGAT
jgi:hypothetical protein